MRVASPSQTTQTTFTLPFVHTSFEDNLGFYFMLYPLWWVLGVEQFLFPMLLGYETLRLVYEKRLDFRWRHPLLIVLGLQILWWMTPALTVRPLKPTFFMNLTFAGTAFLCVFLVYNRVTTRESWMKVLRALNWLAVWLALGAVLYLSGLWQGQLTSAVGQVIPQATQEDSVFYEEISTRFLGEPIPAREGFLSHRVRSFAMHFSSFAMSTVILIPVALWYATRLRGGWRWAQFAVVGALLAGLIYSQSRMSYITVFLALVLYGFVSWFGWRRLWQLALAGVGGVVLVFVGLLVSGMTPAEVINLPVRLFTEVRPGSFNTRTLIYIRSIQELPQHPITGWGQPMQMGGWGEQYSLGTHSSYLNALFQHGAVGLMIDGAWRVLMWGIVVRALLLDRARSGLLRTFMVMAAAALLAFQLREITDHWMWDYTRVSTYWLFLALIFGAYQLLLAGDDEQEAAADAITTDEEQPEPHTA